MQTEIKHVRLSGPRHAIAVLKDYLESKGIKQPKKVVQYAYLNRHDSTVLGDICRNVLLELPLIQLRALLSPQQRMKVGWIYTSRPDGWHRRKWIKYCSQRKKEVFGMLMQS